ncbi:site-2 protease family protein [Candidatus Pelagibacter sp.]|nr:site-2 protease family protein [Candidatus Pelagibacter sp.]|tara:strand:- start:243 stop:2345 length:2103 start_codon:yes stop_codon:yes gene_type:complete
MIIPYLRQDLEIFRGNSREDGAPAWLLYDAVRNKYFTLGLTAFKLIKNWSGGEDIQNFEKKINKSGIDTTVDEITSFIGFLQQNNLIIQPPGQNISYLLQQKNSMKKGWLMNLIHSYLFFKIPLFKPDEWLGRNLNKVKSLGSSKFRKLIYILGFIGICLVIQQFEIFKKTFLYFFTFKGLMLYFVTLVVVKCLHELGHAFVAKYFGCRVSAIGIAFLVFFPFLYTDTTDAWRLRNHKERLLINFAGVLTELHLALLATFVWGMLPEGGLKSVAFFVATTSWISSLIINVSPFMRFDGYYVFSDWLKAENLQPRSFALARWKIREMLFGFNHKPPEEINPSRRWTFIIYAWGTWLYRFFLFIGIALLVYHLAFKVLGIILFIIEIYWFIMLPIIKEVKNWYMMKSEMKINKQTIRTILILIVLCMFAFLPWKSSLKIPAVYISETYSKVYSPYPAKIKQIYITKDDQVEKGQKLLELYSPDLDKKINSTRRKIKLIKTKINSLSDTAGNMDQYITLQQRLLASQSEVRGLANIKSKLILKSPIKGKIKDFSGLTNEMWVDNTTQLLGIVHYGTGQVKGLIKEEQLDRFKENAPAVFIPNDGEHQKIHLISSTLDLSAVQNLPYVSLSSIHNGPIAIRNFTSGEFQYRPETAHYIADFKLINKSSIQFELPGYVHIEGSRYSPFIKFFKNIIALLVRESGF